MTATSILVYAPSWIGDAVMSLGALRSFKRAHPASRVTVLTRPWVRELFEACEAADAALVYDPSGADRGARGFLAAAKRIRDERFDASLVLPNAFRAAALVWTARIPERWGYATESRGLLLTKKVPPAPRPFGRHQAYFYLDLLSGLGIETGEPDLRLQATEAMLERARVLLDAEGFEPERPLIGVHPGATNSRSKLWKPERFAEVAERLATAHGARIVILGGAGDVELAARVRAGLKEPPLMLAGKSSLGELIGVLARLSLLLTNDSGPMHLAAALGAPTVAVFGPTDPRETGPYTERARVVREPVECSPCLYRDCPIDHRCMERVGPGPVYEAAQSLFAPAGMTAEAFSK